MDDAMSETLAGGWEVFTNLNSNFQSSDKKRDEITEGMHLDQFELDILCLRIRRILP